MNRRDLFKLAGSIISPSAFIEPDRMLTQLEGDPNVRMVDLWYFRPAIRELLQVAQLSQLMNRTNENELCGISPGFLKFSYWGWQEDGKLEIMLTFRTEKWEIAGLPLYDAADFSLIGNLLRRHEAVLN